MNNMIKFVCLLLVFTPLTLSAQSKKKHKANAKKMKSEIMLDSLPSQNITVRFDSMVNQFEIRKGIEGKEVIQLAKSVFAKYTLAQLNADTILLPTLRYVADAVTDLSELNRVVDEYEKIVGAWRMSDSLLYNGFTGDKVLQGVRKLAEVRSSDVLTVAQGKELDSLLIFFTTDICNLRRCTYSLSQLLNALEDALQPSVDFESAFHKAINDPDRNELIRRVPCLEMQRRGLLEKLQVDADGYASRETVVAYAEVITQLKEKYQLLYQELKEQRAAIELAAKYD